MIEEIKLGCGLLIIGFICLLPISCTMQLLGCGDQRSHHQIMREHREGQQYREDERLRREVIKRQFGY
jgi:hypothetical protein